MFTGSQDLNLCVYTNLIIGNREKKAESHISSVN